MFFWPCHDLSEPPSHVLRRRPISGNYWESKASSSEEAIESFRKRWMRETGRECQIYHAKEVKPTSIIHIGQMSRRVNKKKDQNG